MTHEETARELLRNSTGTSPAYDAIAAALRAAEERGRLAALTAGHMNVTDDCPSPPWTRRFERGMGMASDRTVYLLGILFAFTAGCLCGWSVQLLLVRVLLGY